MSTNWHTTSQGPKKKSIQITKGKIDHCPAPTARNKGSFTTMVLWIVQRFLSSTVCGDYVYYTQGSSVKKIKAYKIFFVMKWTFRNPLD